LPNISDVEAWSHALFQAEDTDRLEQAQPAEGVGP
jgi:hypothetical protein